MGADLTIAETMKKKYNLEKKRRGYAIISIQNKGVCISTQFLAGKVMRKCRGSEVIATVIMLAE